MIVLWNNIRLLCVAVLVVCATVLLFLNPYVCVAMLVIAWMLFTNACLEFEPHDKHKSWLEHWQALGLWSFMYKIYSSNLKRQMYSRDGVEPTQISVIVETAYEQIIRDEGGNKTKVLLDQLSFRLDVDSDSLFCWIEENEQHTYLRNRWHFPFTKYYVHEGGLQK